jgi:LEA14-like dessication related protein
MRASQRLRGGVLARLFIFLFLALDLLSGCVSKPVVALDHAELASASLQGLGLAVVLQINNPNSYDVQVRSLHVEVTIAGRYALAPIDVQPNQWLPSNETTRVAVPVVIPWPVIPALISETLGSPQVTYRVRGSADVTAVRMLGIERNNYPVDEEGSLPRQIFIDASSGSIRF